MIGHSRPQTSLALNPARAGPNQECRPRISVLTPPTRALLADGAAALHVPLSNRQLGAFERYAFLLDTWRRKFNLTAVRAPEAIVRVLFLESIACLLGGPIGAGAAVIDVGSGAGFPGVPMKIARPDLKMTLLDASRHRAAFLELLSSELDIDLDVIHGRAEIAGHKSDLRERFDVAVSRATAPLPHLAELCLAFVKVGGLGIFPKGGNISAEWAGAAVRVQEMGGQLARFVPIEAPWSRSRSRNLVIVTKIAHTPGKFPTPRQRGRSAGGPLI